MNKEIKLRPFLQKMKDDYLERKNNPEIRLPEDMSDEEYLRYMNNLTLSKKQRQRSVST